MNQKAVKLNIGCGLGYTKGWINVDKAVPSDIRANVLVGMPIKDVCCDIIFLSHLLEHFCYNDAKEFLFECNRISKIGAIIRIIVPNLGIFARKYFEKDEVFYNQPGPHDGFRFKGDTLGDKFMFVVLSDGHKYCYDFDSLKNLLQKCGFGNIVKSSFGDSQIEGISSLDTRPEVSLFVEAQKIREMGPAKIFQRTIEYTVPFWKRCVRKVLQIIHIR
jgi:predicted SAM-dependent methyltransferase